MTQVKKTASRRTQTMNQAIDSIKLKTSAEHLEWVLRQYPENKDVQGLLHALMPLIEDAKAGRLTQPIESLMKVPGAHRFSDGLYVPFRDSGVGKAYAEFITELEGGLTEEERQLLREVDGHRFPCAVKAGTSLQGGRKS